jgi:DNA-binding NtrC family response regulator
MSNRHTVLLAEDQIGYRLPIQNFLEDEGFHVIPAEDVDRVWEYGPDADALVVDVRLPSGRLEGIDVVARLITEKQLSPEVPIIFISVHDQTDEICQNKLREFPGWKERYTWLQKPFELELLVKILRDKIPNRNG